MLWATSAPGVRSTFTATAPTGAFLQSSITGSTGSNTPVPSHQGCPLFLPFEKVYKFSKDVGLPTCLADLEFGKDKLEELAENAVAMKDIEHNPYKITKEMVACSMSKLEKMK